MAYKHETDQQFIETIVRQVGSGSRSPYGDHQYHGNRYSAHTAYDDHDPDNGFEVAEPETVDSMRGKFSSFAKPYRSGSQIDQEMHEPMPQLGGYSSDAGRHMEAPHPAQPSYMDEKIQQRREMRGLIKSIEAKEKELHELQQQKVELMRKITGRL